MQLAPNFLHHPGTKFCTPDLCKKKRPGREGGGEEGEAELYFPPLIPPQTHIGRHKPALPTLHRPASGAMRACGRRRGGVTATPPCRLPPRFPSRRPGQRPAAAAPPPLSSRREKQLPSGPQNPGPPPGPSAPAASHHNKGGGGRGEAPPSPAGTRPGPYPSSPHTAGGASLPAERPPGAPRLSSPTAAATGPPAETAPGPTSSSASCAAALLPQRCLPLRARPPRAHWLPPHPAPGGGRGGGSLARPPAI